MNFLVIFLSVFVFGQEFHFVINRGDIGIVKFDPGSGEFSLPEKSEYEKLNEKIKLNSSSWLKENLIIHLLSFDETVRQKIVEKINSTEEKFRDEVAFVISELPPEDLNENADEVLENIVLNARLVYKMAEEFQYLTIKEDESKGMTTIVFKTKEGEFKISPEYYYNYIVHPVCVGESLYGIDVKSGKKGNYFCRKYLTGEDVKPEDDYRRGTILNEPNIIADDEIKKYDAYGEIEVENALEQVDFLIDENGKSVLSVYHFAYDNDKKSKVGSVLITTIPVEKYYEEGKGAMLENLVLAGNNQTVITKKYKLNKYDKIGILMDKNPFGSDGIEKILKSKSKNYDVFSSQDILKFVYSDNPGEGEISIKKYDKFIVPSDQPAAVYEALAQKKGVFEKWLGTSRANNSAIFEFHAALSDEDVSYSELELPFGIKVLSPYQSNRKKISQVKGFPDIFELLKSVPYVWNGKPKNYGSGDLTEDKIEDAIDAVLFFIGKNHPVTGFEAGFTPPSEKDKAPSCFFTFRHFGDSKDYLKILTSALRFALIPAVPTMIATQSKYFSQVYLNDKWLPVYVEEGSDEFIFDDKGIIDDKDSGGMVEVPFVTSFKGDGETFSSIKDYSSSIVVEAMIFDENYEGVDGALVSFSSDIPGTSYNAVGAEIVTDTSGRAKIFLGDSVPFYIKITSVLGVYPEGFQSVAPFLTANMTKVDGEYFPLEFKYTTGKVNNFDIIETDSGTPVEKWDVMISNTFQVTSQTSSFTGKTFSVKRQGGVFDVFVVDKENLEALLNNPDGVIFAQSIKRVKDTPSEFVLKLFKDKISYIIFSNRRNSASAIDFDVSIKPHVEPVLEQTDVSSPADLSSEETVEGEDAVDGESSIFEKSVSQTEESGGGGGCSFMEKPSSVSGMFTLIFILFLLFFFSKRRFNS